MAEQEVVLPGAKIRSAQVTGLGGDLVQQQVVTLAKSDGTLDPPFYQATQPVSGTVAVGNLPATQPVSGSVAVTNFPATQPVSGTVTVSNPSTLSDVSDRSARLVGHVTVDNFPGAPSATLTSRLLGKAPQAGYRLWLDTANTSFIYIAEAPLAETAGTGTVFNIIRSPLDVNSNIVGKTEENTGIAWTARTTATGWS